jgi:hypothetical protein
MAVAATIADSSGIAQYVSTSGETDHCTINISGSNTSFNTSVASGTITNNFGSGTTGSATVTIPTANMSGISVVLSTVSTQELIVEATNLPVSYVGSSGTTVVIVSSNGNPSTGNLTAILGNITVAPTAGNVSQVEFAPPANSSTVAISSTQITGLLPSANVVDLTPSGGTIGTVLFASATGVSWTINSTSTTIQFSFSGAATGTAISVFGLSNTLTIPVGLSGGIAYTIGSNANGLDNISMAFQVISSSTSNTSLTYNNSGSATTGSTTTVTPGSAQNVVSTIARSSHSTVSYKATNTSDNYSGGLSFTTPATETIVIAGGNNFLDNATINGTSGSAINVSSLSSWSDNGSNTITLSNSKTISYSGVTAVTPANSVAPVSSGTAQVGQTLSTTTGTWTWNSANAYTYLWKHGDGSAAGGTATGSTYTPVSADIGFAMVPYVTATNGGGAVTQAGNATGTVTAASSSIAGISAAQMATLFNRRR